MSPQTLGRQVDSRSSMSTFFRKHRHHSPLPGLRGEGSIPSLHDTPARRTALVGRAREGHFQARPHDVPLFAWTGTTVPRRTRHSSHQSCITTSATFRQPTPAHCASLSTQHIRSSGFSGRWSDGLELTAR